MGASDEGSAYTREHLAAALTWIERNVYQGIALVARALASYEPPVVTKGGDSDEQFCYCGHRRREHDFADNGQEIPCCAHVADRICDCPGFKRARVVVPVARPAVILGDSVDTFGVNDAGPLTDDDSDQKCTDPGGHVWHEGEPDRAGEGPIRCIYCGADGDA